MYSPVKGGKYCFWWGSPRRDIFFCVQDISKLTSGRIETKFAWIYMYHWGVMKTWLYFGDLVLIFKVTAEQNRSDLNICGYETSVFSLKILVHSYMDLC